MPVTKEEVIEFIENMSVLELSEFIKEVVERKKKKEENLKRLEEEIQSWERVELQDWI